ncbi:Diphthamide synthase subunit DPH2/tumor suppressor protein-like protein [Giardia duodenalis assemblage B]|uniref:2-(3-amino-3-carboxypropyl)histidine synthase subunit 1 n=1 Tax=Giardia duodenalis assemblage B TaxID=1394984 RepID=A0A132NPS1_GIAIN|nr:Diphthamide synthase subunit DPH2/tumor suppressor protein-like protein [Giardia intestinalis assemblage B]
MNFSLECIVDEMKSILQGRSAPRGYHAVGLQFPEGLMEQAVDVCNALEGMLETVDGVAVEYVIFADVLYGACNIDDIGCMLMGVDILVHFGHSKIVPNTLISVIYVPVIDGRGSAAIVADGLTDLCKAHGYKVVGLVTTAQFAACLSHVQPILDDREVGIRVVGEVQSPLPKYEILGCTCRRFPPDTDAVVSVVDGDFHYEATCLSNSHLPAYRLSPVTGVYESVGYDTHNKINSRLNVIRSCADALNKLMVESGRDSAIKKVGLVFGTLGRQGSPVVFEALLNKLRSIRVPIKVLSLSEVLPHYLLPHKDVLFFAQLACPRLTIDWDEEISACGLVMVNYYELDRTLDLCLRKTDTDDLEDYALVNFTHDGHKELCYYGRPTA